MKGREGKGRDSKGGFGLVCVCKGKRILRREGKGNAYCREKKKTGSKEEQGTA